MVGCEKCDHTGFAWGTIPCECTDVDAYDIGIKTIAESVVGGAKSHPGMIGVVEVFDADAYTRGARYVNAGCCCHMGHPPCGYCEEGGYCNKHAVMRNDCGCDYDD